MQQILLLVMVEMVYHMVYQELQHTMQVEVEALDTTQFLFKAPVG
jgi:hypothetical protein